MELIKIDDDGRLYTHRTGGYFGCPSCLGFDRAFEVATKISEWLKGAVKVHPENVGTEKGFEEYAQAMEAGQVHHQATNKRCDAELDERFHKFYKSGERVEVVWKDGFEDYTGYGMRTDGRKARFYVGKSTGWIPVYLAILQRSSRGGGSICTSGIESVRGLGIFKGK